jgi:hypothetical protein
MEEVQNTQGQASPKPGKTRNAVEHGMGNEQRQGQKLLEEPPGGSTGTEPPKADKPQSPS